MTHLAMLARKQDGCFRVDPIASLAYEKYTLARLAISTLDNHG